MPQITIPTELLNLYDRLADIGRVMRLAGLDTAVMQKQSLSPGLEPEDNEQVVSPVRQSLAECDLLPKGSQ